MALDIATLGLEVDAKGFINDVGKAGATVKTLGTEGVQTCPACPLIFVARSPWRAFCASSVLAESPEFVFGDVAVL